MKNAIQTNRHVCQWIELSLSDLKSARLLYTLREHRTSYFLFQQSVEKANKAFLLLADTSEDDLKNARHNPIKIYRKSIVHRQAQMEELIATLDIFPEAKNHELLEPLDFEKYKQNLDLATRQIDKLANLDLINIPTNDIHYLLEELYEIEFTPVEIPKKIDQAFIEYMNKVADWIGHFETPEASRMKQDYKAMLNDPHAVKELYTIMKLMIRWSLVLTFISSTFIVCAIFTVQHSELTRYSVDGKDPMKIYNKKLPLVRQQQEIMDIFEKALRRFKQFAIQH